MNGSATADDATGMINLESDGFIAGGIYNTANARYKWEAFAGSDCTSSGMFCVGTYSGSGTNPRLVTTGFQPDLMWVKAATTGNAANWRSSSTPDNGAQFFSATVADATTNYFTTISSNGFNVGTTNNASGVLYHFVAFQNTTNLVNVGTYEGTTADNRNITGVGFVPDYLFIKNADYAAGAVANSTEAYGDSTSYFTDTANLVNSIQALQSDGFQLIGEPGWNSRDSQYR